MKWLGLTGGIGSGKSTVAEILHSRNIPVIDADKVTHHIMSRGNSAYDPIIEHFGTSILGSYGLFLGQNLKSMCRNSAYDPIIEHFGTSILGSDQEIDRKKLGQIVFSNQAQLRKLESIIHPKVRDEVLRRRSELSAKNHQFAVYDVPLLYEKNMESMFDDVILVYCTEEQQIERVQKRNNLSKEQVELRIEQQLPIDEKRKRANIVIDNTGTLDDLEIQTIKWLESYQAQL